MAQEAEQVEITVEGSSAEKERRRGPRYACDGFAEAIVLRPETLVRGEMRDISQRGCFVKTRAHLKLPRATKVELRFAVNGGWYRMDALVTDVRSGEGGIGLQFVPGDAKAEAALNALIQSLSSVGPFAEQGTAAKEVTGAQE